MRRAVRTGVLELLIHPDKPGMIKILSTPSTVEQAERERLWGGWSLHRYRTVEEPELAKSLVWELLGCPAPKDDEPAVVDLNRVEQALRDLNQEMQSRLILAEKAMQLAT
jgi:hypothetical protein